MIKKSNPSNRTHLSKVEAAGLRNQEPSLAQKNSLFTLKEEPSSYSLGTGQTRFGIAAEEIVE